MFMQQCCGVSVIAYYSTTIFIESGYITNTALLASMGPGILNWVFRTACLLYDRYLGSAKPASIYISVSGNLPLLDWLLILVQGEAEANCDGRHGHVSVRSILQPRRRPCPIYVFGRMFPLACQRCRHELGHSYHVEFQFCFILFL